GQAQAVPYVATKGAVTAMTKALALDESPYGVRVNCISPGNIWTPLWEELAALTPDPRATIREGMLAQVGVGFRASHWAAWASPLRLGLRQCSWPPKPTSARALNCS
ncbi:HSD17B14 isoform 2, partial [Pongo abelii]